jgi:hypothetical protein
MSVDAIREVYGWLASSSAITALVPKSDIKIGYPRLKDDYPCITIIQAAGTSYPRLGYGTASAGTKMRFEEPIIQIDVWSTNGFHETDSAAEEITKVMMSGACRQQSSNNDYDDETGIYRRIETYSYIKIHND